MYNEKSLYSSLILESDNGPSGGPINHANIVRACMYGIPLLGHVLTEFERKGKNNLRNIVHRDFVALCGRKPDSAAYKAKPRNARSKYLLGDNLKQATKYAKRSQDITKKDSYRKNFQVQSKHYASTDKKNNFFRSWQENWSKLQSKIDKTGAAPQQQQTQYSSEILQLEVCILHKTLKQHMELFQAGRTKSCLSL